MGLLSALSVSILVYVPLALLAYFLFRTFQAWYPLRKFKGPILASFSNIWRLRAFTSWELNLKYYDIIQNYGELARVSPTELLTADPELVRRMGAARSGYRRGVWYDYARPDANLCSIFTETDMKKHDALRSQMLAGFSPQKIPDLEAVIDRGIESFSKLVEQKYLSTDAEIRPMDIARKSSFLGLDIITELAFGAPFGYLEKDEDLYSYLRELQLGLKLGMGMSTLPWLARLMKTPAIVALVGSAPPGLSKIMGLAKKVSMERFGSEKVERDDMLGVWVRNGLNQPQAEIETFSQLLAGSDTVATALRMTIFYIISNPPVYAKLLAEIDRAVQDGASSPITDAEAKVLPYLQACIKEQLRIWPPFTGENPKQVPKGGDTINGRYLPDGTQILVCIWAIQRHEIFGAHPEVYRPERWLEADEEKEKQMASMMDLVFGYGRTSCMGKQIAYIELGKILFEVFRRYDIVLLNPMRPINSLSLNIWMQNEMMVKISERKMPARSS